MDEMRDRILAAAKRHKLRAAEFLRELIAIPSHSRQEEAIALHVRREMIKLGYPSVEVDRFGNVLGRIGEGSTKIMFDAHMDTTGIGDRSSWRFDPYKGELKAAKVYGHGAANNKGGLAAIVYAGAIMQELDLVSDVTAYIVGSIQAEDCEGLAYKALFDIEKLYPNFVVLSMPTGMRICRGHRGRVEFKITIRGQAVHASTPDKGYNALYGAAKIIEGIKQLNEKLPTDKFLGKATVTVTQVECDNTGPNALPEMVRLIVDRRLIAGEQPKKVIAQIKEIAKVARAKVEIVEFDEPSYRGLRLPMEKYMPTWQLPEDHPLIEAADNAYKSVFNKKKPLIDRWTMSTAGAYTMGVANIPTIGFGPSEESFPGPINDHVRIDDLEKCMAFYATLPGYLPTSEPMKNLRRRR